MLYILQILLLVPSLAGGNDWQKSLDKDDIVVYTRHTDLSKFDEIKAVTTMRGTLADFRDIITDIDAYPDWMPDCKSTTLIESPNANDITYLMKIKVPFPFSNRDVVQRIVLSETGNQLKIDITNTPNKAKKNNKYVRMKIARGTWTVTQINPDKVSIEFVYLADPGGDLPAWLVNSFTVKNPHLTLLHVRQMMAD